MVRFLGGVLILLGCFLYARDFQLRQRQEILVLKGYLELIDHVRMQIEHFSLPVSKILSECDHIGAGTVSQLLETIEADKVLSAEEKKELRTWAGRLGDGYKEEQIARCVFAREKLKGYMDKHTSEYPGKVKANNALSFLVGASLILLLI